MRALVSTPDGREPEIREVAEPQPQPGDAVIEVKAISLNCGELRELVAYADWVPGQDVAGVVLQLLRTGADRRKGVVLAAGVDEGGGAERVAAPATRIGALPDNVPFDAVTLGVAGMTAVRALRAGGSLLNARVLVTGAAGGVGRFAVELAAPSRAETTAVVGALQRGLGLAELGAARVVLESETLAGPFDLVMEGVGGPSLERSVRARAGRDRGAYGGASGVPAELTLGHFSGRPGARGAGVLRVRDGSGDLRPGPGVPGPADRSGASVAGGDRAGGELARAGPAACRCVTGRSTGRSC